MEWPAEALCDLCALRVPPCLRCSTAPTRHFSGECSDGWQCQHTRQRALVQHRALAASPDGGARRQLAAQRTQGRYHGVRALHRREAQGNDVGVMHLGGACDVCQRRLRPQRQAVATFECQQGFGHQQTQAVRLLRYRGQ